MHIRLHDVEGQTLRVGIRRGEKARPPLLLFNGIGANIELVEPFLDALDGPEAIVFDVPGVGGSPSPWLPYRPSSLARLSAQLLDQLGHSQTRRYKDSKYMERIAGDIYGGALRGSPELVHSYLRHVRWSSDYGYYLQLLAGCGWTSLPWLRLLAQPTLVMAGPDDPLVPFANGRILASLIPDAHLVTINDGHLFLVTSASRSAAMISEFLS